jgi:hypothetical protein
VIVYWILAAFVVTLLVACYAVWLVRRSASRIEYLNWRINHANIQMMRLGLDIGSLKATMLKEFGIVMPDKPVASFNTDGGKR